MGMAAMEAQMQQEQLQSEQFQATTSKLNLENGETNAYAQFSNGLADSLKSAAK
jgi:hypothetical protein